MTDYAARIIVKLLNVVIVHYDDDDVLWIMMSPNCL